MKKIYKEKWLPVKDYEENYLVSNYGRICNKKTKKILKPFHCFGKYLYVKLSKNGKAKTMRLHRIVARAFIENKDSKPIVHHIDTNAENNCAENLKWCSYEEHKKIHAELRTKNSKSIGGKQNEQKNSFGN